MSFEQIVRKNIAATNNQSALSVLQESMSLAASFLTVRKAAVHLATRLQ